MTRGRTGFVYGGKIQPLYYSAEDIKEIVDYAAARWDTAPYQVLWGGR